VPAAEGPAAEEVVAVEEAEVAAPVVLAEEAAAVANPEVGAQLSRPECRTTRRTLTLATS
jgi:hypothetical protein